MFYVRHAIGMRFNASESHSGKRIVVLLALVDQLMVLPPLTEFILVSRRGR